MAAGVMLLCVSAQAADDDEDKNAEPPLPAESAELAKKYARVTEWQGFFESSESGTIAWSGTDVHGTKTIDNSSHGHFFLKRADHYFSSNAKRGVFSWTGGDNHTVCGEQFVASDMQQSQWDKWGKGEEWRRQASGTLPMIATQFDIWLPTAKKKSYRVSVHPGGAARGRSLTSTTTGHRVWDENNGDGTVVRRTMSLDATMQLETFVHWYSPVGDADTAPWFQVVRGGPGVLVFSFESKTRADTQPSTPELIRRSRVILCPVNDDLEVEVTIEGYATWRPKGSIEKPAEPGNSLVARATLKSKTGKLKDLPAVKRFKFELLDTSREPGVCLNWPLKAKDEDYDLRLASEVGKLTDSDQKLTITDVPTDEKGSPYTETKVNSYDFGGRATLQVTCELEDGRELMGLIKTDKGEEDLVRIPKMDGPDWVAEAWRKDKHVEKLPANDDNEKVAGQTDNGDGFTLYEEYRGWVEKGKHIEGDPLKKDFFIRNKIGADAKGGIALFGRVSKLRVHGELRASEMIDLPMQYMEAESNAKGERIMNLNHRDGPHRVDQHCVVMINTSGFRSSGGATYSVINGDTTSRALRPGKAYLIRVEERGRSDGTFSNRKSTAQYNLSEREAAVAYDRGVAHELLHSVGVDHHGEGETAHMYYFQGAGDPMNTAHRPRFVERMPPTMDEYGEKRDGRPAVWSDFDRGPAVTLLWEDTGEDVAQSLSTDFERELKAERDRPIYEKIGNEQAARFPQYGQDAAFWRVLSTYNHVSEGNTDRGWRDTDSSTFNKYVTIGRLHEADSGNELCLMRYYFANAYFVDATEKAIYLVRPGGNRVGQELCKSPEGTGQNAPDHKPKSRFGDSAQGRGACFQYICPNDAIPPRTL